jgi:hypothetical protein
MKKKDNTRIFQFLTFNTFNIVLYGALIAMIIFLIKYLY